MKTALTPTAIHGQPAAFNGKPAAGCEGPLRKRRRRCRTALQPGPIPPAALTGATVNQTVNLNGLINRLSALITNFKDPAKLISEVKSGVLTIDALKQTAARAQVGEMLLQVVKAVGLARFDLVTTPMTGISRSLNCSRQ